MLTYFEKNSLVYFKNHGFRKIINLEKTDINLKRFTYLIKEKRNMDGRARRGEVFYRIGAGSRGQSYLAGMSERVQASLYLAQRTYSTM